MAEEGDAIPWDVFFYRAPLIRNITEGGVTRQEFHKNPDGGAFFYRPDPDNFWEVELMALVEQTNAVMFPVPGGIRVWGDGVRLFLPRLWMEDTDELDLVEAIITGIKVSLENRGRLNY